MRALTLLVLSSAFVACQDKAPPPPPVPVTVSVATASASHAPSAAPSAAASATAAPHKPKARAPRSFEALKAELAKKCPAKLDGPTIEMKAEAEKAGQCLRKKMIAELDGVLIPLKTSNPARFKALMAEQADWNRFIDAACFIEEERQWVDFATGQRDDGTLRSFAYLGCISAAMTERLLYARSLAANNTTALSKRIEEQQKDGALVKASIADVAVKSAAFATTPPPKSPDALGGDADFPRIARDADAMQKRTVSLAKATCSGWPELATALGKADCEKKAELYYYVQGNAPDTPNP